MTYDLPKELREISSEIALGYVLPHKSIFPSMAADEIERLRNEVAELNQKYLAGIRHGSHG